MQLQNSAMQGFSGRINEDALNSCVIAKQLERAGDFQGARAALNDAFERLNELEIYARAYVLLRVGILTCRLSSSGQTTHTIERAKDLLTQCLELFEKLKDSSGATEACYGLGLCLHHEGAFDDARLWLRSARERVNEDDKESKCRILLLSAIVEVDAWRLHDALSLHEQIAALCGSIENHTLLGTYHHEYAIALKKLAKIERKRDYEQRALIEYEGACFHYESANNDRCLASGVNNVGVLLMQMGKPVEALNKIEQAITLAKRVQDKTRQAEFLESKAQALTGLGRLQEAETAARHSVELLRFSGRHSLLAESLITHGLTLSRLNRTEESERILRNAEAVATHIGDVETAGRALITLLECGGLTFSERGELHGRIAEYLKDSQNNDLNARHLACVKMTFEASNRGAEKPASLKQGFSLPAYLNLIELELIKLAFDEGDGTLSDAAKLLGITVSCLNEKKKKFPVINDLQKNQKRRSIIKERITPAMLADSSHGLGCTRMSDDDDSMSGLGIYGGDSVIFRKCGEAKEGEPVVIVSRNVDFVGIYHETAAGVELLPACEEYEDIWDFQSETFKVAGRIVAFIKAADIGKPDAKVHPLHS
jgi:tetratricopeptide (TPR) repeat protein